MVWYSRLFQNFPQFIVIHTVEGFGVVNKAETGVFLELSCFFDDPTDVGNLISGFSASSKTSLKHRLKASNISDQKKKKKKTNIKNYVLGNSMVAQLLGVHAPPAAGACSILGR